MRKELIALLGILVGGMTGIIVGAVIVGKISAKTIKEKQTYADKHLSMFMTMNQWGKIKQDGKSIADYLKKRCIKTVAIYGMGNMGQLLLAELKNSDIEVLYGIDKNADIFCCDVDIYTIDAWLPEVDGVVVTSVYYFEEIEDSLCTKMDCPILSLEDIVYEI